MKHANQIFSQPFFKKRVSHFEKLKQTLMLLPILLKNSFESETEFKPTYHFGSAF